MANQSPIDFELSQELIKQYKEALASLSDIRLTILLLFNSFEEIMKSFAAWRLSCHIEELPKFISNSPHNLFEVTLVGPSAKELKKRTKHFSELRNTVAHKFHLKDYEPKLIEFIKENLKDFHKTSIPVEPKVLLEAVVNLALDIASYIDEIQPRGKWPFPLLSLELNAIRY